MENKCKPITAKATQASRPSPNKYMAGLVAGARNVGESQKPIDLGEPLYEGFLKTAKLEQAYKK